MKFLLFPPYYIADITWNIDDNLIPANNYSEIGLSFRHLIVLEYDADLIIVSPDDWWPGPGFFCQFPWHFYICSGDCLPLCNGGPQIWRQLKSEHQEYMYSKLLCSAETSVIPTLYELFLSWANLDSFLTGCYLSWHFYLFQGVKSHRLKYFFFILYWEKLRATNKCRT